MMMDVIADRIFLDSDDVNKLDAILDVTSNDAAARSARFGSVALRFCGAADGKRTRYRYVFFFLPTSEVVWCCLIFDTFGITKRPSKGISCSVDIHGVGFFQVRFDACSWLKKSTNPLLWRPCSGDTKRHFVTARLVDALEKPNSCSWRFFRSNWWNEMEKLGSLRYRSERTSPHFWDSKHPAEQLQGENQSGWEAKVGLKHPIAKMRSESAGPPYDFPTIWETRESHLKWQVGSCR